MRLQGIIRRGLHAGMVLTVAPLLLVSCSDNQAPEPAPRGITIVSGDGQYSKKGTALEQPVVFEVIREDGKPAAGESINFQVIEGGGSLSRASATTNASGITSVAWTLGPNTGLQSIRATVARASAINAMVQATSSEYYCPEEDPAFSRKFQPQSNLLLFTRDSILNPHAGLVQIEANFPSLTASSFLSFDEGQQRNVVRDCAFSANGDFFVAWTTGSAVHEILKIEPNGSNSHFATLDPVHGAFGTEICLLPNGVLAGCDRSGPFTVGCRDTLVRYEDATFTGEIPDAANDDAVAASPVTGDLYFIHLASRSLQRVPLDGYTQTGPTETVVTLSIDEAYGARGMVVDDNDGSVFILVDIDNQDIANGNTKSIVKVTEAGVKTTEVDFFLARGAGDAAGIQRDLAIDQGLRHLYTLDTLNNVIVGYQIATQTLFTLTGGPDEVSDATTKERVGLAVMP